jgi:hypothetical protein
VTIIGITTTKTRENPPVGILASRRSRPAKTSSSSSLAANTIQPRTITITTTTNNNNNNTDPR